ncbi:MAG TPA: ABC transporter permease subunit, partial [Acidobacteriota bacterium]
SQFLHPRFRIVVKPTMEIMASLPSVVLGFLAALWLAPLLETKVPSILLILIIVPTVSLLIGWTWGFLPIEMRVKIKPGYEWIAFIPILLVVAWLAWEFGPAFEKLVFSAKDPATGVMIPDFRLWWRQTTSLAFEQRNSLVVGFMMGFAVIPIIFTIAEDAMSNVPGALRSGSLALGASRWQTALRIVLPTASAGIFSALMIGLGRAVGETMIVVMATGNTPIMDMNIFSGMRTLSANIAVELPEAPVHGTLYRTLFLGALALFILTFVVNTLAELLRQHLREKYKTV